MKGTVKFYNADKKYGFILAEDEKQIFVHESGLAEGVTSLEKDEEVTFDVEEGEKGLKAINVKKA
ncbi:MAG: cold shock domain-containing protein [Nanoarchaeota archaeon]|nr:cold shock domain-containing protein [Nanoarchaeota archaeon]